MAPYHENNLFACQSTDNKYILSCAPNIPNKSKYVLSVLKHESFRAFHLICFLIRYLRNCMDFTVMLVDVVSNVVALRNNL